MGYFSNGSEGAAYEAHYCTNCIHYDLDIGVDPPCPVWMAHTLHNYEECNNPDSILHLLIPRDEDGLGNGQCKMFVGRDGAQPGQESLL